MSILKEVYNDLQGLTILEMRMYLRFEIAKFCTNDYRTMDIERKLYLYNLNSFLYFCNEIKDRDLILKKMKDICEDNKFKDRYE